MNAARAAKAGFARIALGLAAGVASASAWAADSEPVRWQLNMPEGEHAWVYCNRTQQELETVLRNLAAGEEPPEADPDAKYAPPTNSNRPYSSPALAEGEPPKYVPVLSGPYLMGKFKKTVM